MRHAQFPLIIVVLVMVAVITPVGAARATGKVGLTTISLEQPVHFLTPDGSDVVADPGDYSVETAQEWLRLIPGTERRNALLIEAQKGTHEVKVKVPIVISTDHTEFRVLAIQLRNSK